MGGVPISAQAGTAWSSWNADCQLSGSLVPELADHLNYMKVYCNVGPYHFLWWSIIRECPISLIHGPSWIWEYLREDIRHKFLFAVKLHTFCQSVLSLTVQLWWIIPCKMPLKSLLSTIWLSSLKIFNISCRKQVNVNKTDTVSGDQSCKKGPSLCQLLTNVTLRGE